MKARKCFRCVLVQPNDQNSSLCTGITVNVPDGLTRTEAIAYVTGIIAGEISRYAAAEALGLTYIDQHTDWSEKVT